MFLFGPPNIEKMKARRDVKALIQALGYKKDYMIRDAAAKSLGELGDPRAVQPLIAALRDESLLVRCTAAQALGWIGDPRAAGALITALDDSVIDVQEYAAEALVKIGSPAVDALIAALSTSQGSVKEHVAKILGMIGDIRAAEPLIAALKAQSSSVRRAAAIALGKIGDPCAVDPLIFVLDDQHGEVARAAANALKRIGDPRGIEHVNAWDAPRIAKMAEKREAKRLRDLVDDYVRSLDSIVISDWKDSGDLIQEGDTIIPFIVRKLRSLIKTGDYTNLQHATCLFDVLGRINTPAAVEAAWEFVSTPSRNRQYDTLIRRSAIECIVYMRDLEPARDYIQEIVSKYLAMVPDNEELSAWIRDVTGYERMEQTATGQKVESGLPKEESVMLGDSEQERPLYLPNKLYSGIRFGSGGVGCGLEEGVYGPCFYKTSDGGETWQKVDIDGLVTAVYFINLDTGWACVRDYNNGNSFVVKTSDGGATWIESKSLTDYQLESIFFVDNNHGWVVGWGGKIFATTNGGMRWVAQRSGVKTPLWGVHFIDTQTGCAVGEEGVILRTTNGGQTWSFVESGTAAWLRVVFFTDCLYGWAVGKAILATKDGGITWSKCPTGWGKVNSLISAYFANRRSGWAATRYELIITEDGGLTWKATGE